MKTIPISPSFDSADAYCRLINTTANHNKFYEIHIFEIINTEIFSNTKYEVWTRYGKIGTAGINLQKSRNLPNMNDAQFIAEELKQIKIKKGYKLAVENHLPNAKITIKPLYSKPRKTRHPLYNNRLGLIDD